MSRPSCVIVVCFFDFAVTSYFHTSRSLQTTDWSSSAKDMIDAGFIMNLESILSVRDC